MTVRPVYVQLPPPCPGCWGGINLPSDTEVVQTTYGITYKTSFPDHVRVNHEEGCPLVVE